MSENPVILKDSFLLFCTDLLGEGISRKVYSSVIDKNIVVKVEEGARSFQNIIEWETWNTVCGTKWERWFAPCLHISTTGSVLVMERTYVPRSSLFPKRLPRFLTDTKRSNYGLYKNRLVCHDYGTNLLMDNGLSDKTHRVNWWDE